VRAARSGIAPDRLGRPSRAAGCITGSPPLGGDRGTPPGQAGQAGQAEDGRRGRLPGGVERRHHLDRPLRRWDLGIH
jgi:hypothetical protein